MGLARRGASTEAPAAAGPPSLARPARFGADLLPTGHWQHAIRQGEGGLLRHAGRGGLRGAGRQQQADEQDEQKGLAHGLLHGWGSRVPAKSDIQ